MAKVTSKRQVTLPKRLADELRISPGDEIHFEAAGGSIRIVPSGSVSRSTFTLDERVRLFDQATKRTKQRAQASGVENAAPGCDRGWTREELYRRGRSD